MTLFRSARFHEVQMIEADWNIRMGFFWAVELGDWAAACCGRQAVCQDGKMNEGADQQLVIG
jgi:hypothetical protein